MTPDPKYSNVLLELKARYQEKLTKLETETSRLKAKLTSLDTLIEDPLLGSDLLSILQGEVDSLTSAAPASASQETVEPKAEAKQKKAAPKASPSSGKRKSPTSKKSAPKSTKKVEPKAEVQSKGTAPKASLSSAKKKPATSKKATSASKVTEPVKPQAEDAAPNSSSSTSKKESAIPKQKASQTIAKKKKQTKASSASSTIRMMNKPYDQMSKIDAITQIMKEKPGNLVHMDDLILKLYGELSGDELKAERKRMHNTMYQGTQQNRWIKSPKEPMSYLVEESAKTKPEAAKTKSSKSNKKT